MNNIEVYNLAYLGFFFLVAICFSMLINFLILRFSRTLGVRDAEKHEGLIRWGSTTKPSLGGFSFYIVFLISVAVLGVMPIEGGSAYSGKLVGLLAASSLGFLIGLADDAYNTNPLVKFIGQFTCANLLVISDFSIQVTPSEPFNYFITVVWVIGLMNSINMLDNMDAITTSVSISVLIGAVAIIFLDGAVNNVYTIIILGVLGALIGFLYFNWNPSKMYMGDTGSQFLGVFLAGVSILFFWNYRSNEVELIELRQFLIPALLFIVPLIDTTTVSIRRLMRKQSPFVGGRDHITHHLAYLGLSDGMVAFTLLTVSLMSIPMVVYIYGKFEVWHYGYTFAFIGYFVGMFLIMQVLYNIGKRKHEEKLAAEE